MSIDVCWYLQSFAGVYRASQVYRLLYSLHTIDCTTSWLKRVGFIDWNETGVMWEASSPAVLKSTLFNASKWGGNDNWLPQTLSSIISTRNQWPSHQCGRAVQIIHNYCLLHTQPANKPLLVHKAINWKTSAQTDENLNSSLSLSGCSSQQEPSRFSSVSAANEGCRLINTAV